MSLSTDREGAAHPSTAYDDRASGSYVRAAGFAVPLFLTAILGIVVTAWIALYTTTGQHYDETAMQVLDGAGSTVNDRLVRLLEQVSVGSAVIALLVMIAVALVRGRFRLAVAAVVLVLGANLTTQVLKRYLLTRPDLGVDSIGMINTLPSGHTTVVFSLALAAVLVSPRALRGLVAFVGSAVGALTGLATVMAGWHRPSDVVAGLLVTVAWAALVSGLLAGTPRDGVRGSGGTFAALLGGALAAVGVIVYGFGWTAGPDASRVIPLTAAVIAGVAAVGLGAYASLVARTSN
jgi:membrane-associated phospholipid phosphatase